MNFAFPSSMEIQNSSIAPKNAASAPSTPPSSPHGASQSSSFSHADPNPVDLNSLEKNGFGSRARSFSQSAESAEEASEPLFHSIRRAVLRKLPELPPSAKKIIPLAKKAPWAVMVAVDLHHIANAEDKVKAAAEVVTAESLAWAGAKGGAWLGVKGGALICGAPCAAIGAGVGGIAFGFAGYFGGAKLAGWIYDWVEE